MALSDDQKAILRLLSQRGEQGYEDLSALMGISAEEVYARAKGAAADLEAEGIPAPDIPQPVGGSGSPSVAKDGEAPPGEPVPPRASEPQKPTPLALPKGPPKPPLKKELKLLEGRGLWALLAGAAVVILFVVFVLFGAGGGDNGGGDTTTTSSSSPSGETVAALEKAAEQGNQTVTKASLEAVDGSDATGVAIFGRVKKSLALQIAAEGLEPTGDGESYSIWLAASPQKMLPLASTEVGEDGRIGAQVEVPTEVLAYLANETFGQIAITRTDDSQLEASLAKATKEKQAPVYTGDEVLRGDVVGPIVGAASRLEEQKKGE